MKVPFIKYVEALIMCKYPPDKIMEDIHNLKVPLSDVFTFENLQQVYNSLKKEDKENYFSSDASYPSPEWLRDLGVIKFVAYDKKLEIPEGVFGIKGALELLKDPQMYMIISSIAMANASEEDIELIINEKYNIHYTLDDIKEFIRYFFNVYDWTLSEKRDYIQCVNDQTLVKYYNLALEGDKDYLFWKLGIAPDKPFDQMLRSMMLDAFYNFKEKMKLDPELAQKWGNLSLRITDRMERLDRETKEQKNLFDEIQFVLSGKKENLDGVSVSIENKYKHYNSLVNEEKDNNELEES